MNWAQRPVANSFVTRLRQSQSFGAADLAAIAALPVDIRNVDANGTIVPEGSRGDRIHVLLDGWAARFKILENGSRQIPALMLPGDMCDIDALHLDRNDCGTMAVTRCTVAVFQRDQLTALFDKHRGVRDAVYRMMSIDNAIATQWTVCLGRRSARERLAHLLCELHARLDAVGHASDGASGRGFMMPLTQEEIADVLGLTAVHVNRTLQGLRSDGLIQLRDHRLTIPDEAALRRVAGFDGGYLHLPNGPTGPARNGRMVAEASRAYA